RTCAAEILAAEWRSRSGQSAGRPASQECVRAALLSPDIASADPQDPPLQALTDHDFSAFAKWSHPRCGLPANGHLQPACEKFRLAGLWGRMASCGGLATRPSR